MSKFVFAYRGGRGMAATPEAQEKVMAEWGAWFGSLGANLVDGGNPFGAAVTIQSDGGSAEGGSAALTGYSIVDAFDLTAAGNAGEATRAGRADGRAPGADVGR